MIDQSWQKEDLCESSALVTEKLSLQLQQFRSTHVYKHVDIGSAKWKYMSCGEGEETVLLLPGAPGICETSFQQILMLEHSYCVLSLIYPSSVKTMTQMINGLQAILALENIKQVHVIGTSYGGAIAQCLLLQIPEKLRKVVLICTGIPNTKTAKKYKAYYAGLSLLPAKGIHSLLLYGKSRFLSGLTAQHSFWSAYYDQMIPSLSKEDYLTRIQLWIEFHQSGIFFERKNLQQNQEILIVEAESDTVFPLKEQQLLEAQYPQAQIYLLSQASHMAALSNTDKCMEVITSFFSCKSDQ